MNTLKVIVDSGPLVAFINKSDHYHAWAVEQFSLLIPPFYTCESVLSETCFLLRNAKNGPQNVLKLLDRDLVEIPFQIQEELTNIIALMKKYTNVPMSLADACLVRMSEQFADGVICTLDSDFRIYRKAKRKVIPLIIPENV